MSEVCQSGIKRDKLSDQFPMNDKKHKMQTRDYERYTVKFANTKRLKHSSIIKMQNILHDDANTTKTPELLHCGCLL